jgi:hypothetical protein
MQLGKRNCMKGIAAVLKITALIVVKLQNSKPLGYHVHLSHVIAQAHKPPPTPQNKNNIKMQGCRFLYEPYVTNKRKFEFLQSIRVKVKLSP